MRATGRSKEGSLVLNALSSENGHILSLFSLLALASSLESQKRSMIQRISKGSFVFIMGFEFPFSSSPQTINLQVLSVLKNRSNLPVFLFHCQPQFETLIMPPPCNITITFRGFPTSFVFSLLLTQFSMWRPESSSENHSWRLLPAD